MKLMLKADIEKCELKKRVREKWKKIAEGLECFVVLR